MFAVVATGFRDRSWPLAHVAAASIGCKVTGTDTCQGWLPCYQRREAVWQRECEKAVNMSERCQTAAGPF